MKKLIITIVTGLFLSNYLPAQVAINNDSTPAHQSAGLEIKFPDKGYLQPRLTGTQIQAVPNPVVGLMVYNLTSNKPVYYDGKQWRNYDGTANWFGCGNKLEVIHIAGNSAPVNKTVIYGTVKNIPGETSKCWITQNLGADHQPTAYDDATEESAGWYWQFSKLQGYKHDGTTRTPNSTWITNISENSNWTCANDPCAIELGGRWRTPLETEWNNVKNAGSWSDYNGPWGSNLKLHEAGRLASSTGELTGRGTYGRYWSSTQQSSTTAIALLFSTTCTFNADTKIQGYSVRCVQCPETTKPDSPTAGTHVVTANRIIWHWTAVSGAAGYLWNTEDDYLTASDMLTSTSKPFIGLDYSTPYTCYVWAYDSCGHSDSYQLSASTTSFTCGTDSLYIQHDAGSVAPVSKSTKYSTVTSIPGETSKCWITSNLGSDRQATANSDTTEASRGWYWQFNRKQGYKYQGTIRTPNTTWISTIDENLGWMPVNDPCISELGNNWRLPTETEWKNIDAAGSWTTIAGPWGSNLKLHAAGRLNYNNGILDYQGTDGRYWSNGPGISTQGWLFRFNSSNSYADSLYGKTYGCSVRCIHCPSDPAPGSPTAGTHVASYNQVTWNWNSVAGATGYKWNTSYNYSTASDMGTNTQKIETSLNYGTAFTRYVWAYNDCGHSTPVMLTASTLAFSCGNSVIYKQHTAGTVAPVTKSTSYGTVTNIPGETSKCWITSNLGSDHQATAYNDATEPSAGWYWQFNKKQGYKHTGTVVTPSWTITAIDENASWTTANDPCAIELGTGWRLPTETEWINVDAAGPWTTYSGPWNSGLYMHEAGRIAPTDGSLTGRGSYGRYWGGTQENNTTAWALLFSTNCYLNADSKAQGYSVRCIKP